MSEQKDPIILENEFYSKDFNFSYSSINLLLYAPVLFYKKYILGVGVDTQSEAMTEGKVIHALLLDNGNFEKNFVVSPADLPTDNVSKVINIVLNKVRNGGLSLDKGLCFHDELIIDTLKEVNLYQSLKTDDQRVDKIVTNNTESYWQFLLSKGDKTLLDQETLDRCKEDVSIIRSNSHVYFLLEGIGMEVRNEDFLRAKIKEYPFGLHGQIDNYCIDHKAKTVYINDLKTSGKTLAEFKESLDYYRYWMQAAIYVLLVRAVYELGPDWKVKFTFIVIDKYQQVYPFEVSDESMTLWLKQLSEILVKVDYHYSKRSF